MGTDMSNIIQFPTRVDFPMPGPDDDYTEPDPPEDPEEIAPHKVGAIWFWLGAALGLSIL